MDYFKVITCVFISLMVIYAVYTGKKEEDGLVDKAASISVLISTVFLLTIGGISLFTQDGITQRFNAYESGLVVGVTFLAVYGLLKNGILENNSK